MRETNNDTPIDNGGNNTNNNQSDLQDATCTTTAT